MCVFAEEKSSKALDLPNVEQANVSADSAEVPVGQSAAVIMSTAENVTSDKIASISNEFWPEKNRRGEHSHQREANSVLERSKSTENPASRSHEPIQEKDDHGVRTGASEPIPEKDDQRTDDHGVRKDEHSVRKDDHVLPPVPDSESSHDESSDTNSADSNVEEDAGIEDGLENAGENQEPSVTIPHNVRAEELRHRFVGLLIALVKQLKDKESSTVSDDSVEAALAVQVNGILDDLETERSQIETDLLRASSEASESSASLVIDSPQHTVLIANLEVVKRKYRQKILSTLAAGVTPAQELWSPQVDKLFAEMERERNALDIDLKRDSNLAKAEDAREAALKNAEKYKKRMEAAKQKRNFVSRESRIQKLDAKQELLTPIQLSDMVASLSKKTIAEITSMKQPPAALVICLRAALLLLGNKQHSVETWNSIRAVLKQKGDLSLKSQVDAFNIKSLKQDVVKRVSKMIDALDSDTTQASGQVTAAFYFWVSSA
jgi:hypothetical protein